MADTNCVKQLNIELSENMKAQPNRPTAPPDGTFDISSEALGSNQPPDYYLSPRFVGSVAVQ